MRKKNKTISIRVSDVCFQKLLAICAVSKKSKTALIEEFISKEYNQNYLYERKLISDLNKNI